jgi:16S rRNA (cytosine1402-N4)-methyltransferase
MIDRDRYHVPVLSHEVCDFLCRNKRGIYVDATLGGGGHFAMIARQLQDDAILIGIDRDPDAVAWNRAHPVDSKATVVVEQACFSQIASILDKHKIDGIDGALLDLGVSSFQIDTADRGFSFMQPCDLDMRMNPREGTRARDLIERYSTEELADVLGMYGEVKNGSRMASAIKQSEKVPQTSDDLRDCLRKEYGSHLKFKVLSKVFMALRIAVNDELNELRRFLTSIVMYLKDGARVAVISYHSLEDRMVKEFFRNEESHCICPPEALFCTCGKPGRLKRITRKPIVASHQEITRNPRSRSARLRVAEKRTGGNR